VRSVEDNRLDALYGESGPDASSSRFRRDL